MPVSDFQTRSGKYVADKLTGRCAAYMENLQLRIGALGDSLKGKLFQAMYKGTVAPEIGGP